MKNTKRALLLSALAIVMSVAMLIGSTFAWFTDSASTAVNTIQSGTLKVELQYQEKDGTWVDAEGKTLDFKKAAGAPTDEKILWEPGCTYELPAIKVVNKGNLALQYQIVITGITGDAKLNEVIEWTYNGTTLEANGMILPEKESDPIVIEGHMKESAGNEYQDLTIDGIAITVYATQVTYEFDSNSNLYDKDAAWDGVIPTTLPDTVVFDAATKTVTLKDPAAFAALALVRDEITANYGGRVWEWSINLDTDVNLLGKPWKPVTLKGFKAFNGNGHVIANLYVNENGVAGLFGEVTNNDSGNTVISNLTIDGAYVKGNESVGALIGKNWVGSVDNVTINNATVIGNKYVGGVFGWGNGDVNNSTVKNSTVKIDKTVYKDNGSINTKEAGGLAGYISNDGSATTVDKVIANNLVENVTVVAPSIASALVAQPNSSNKGGAKIVIENNTVKNASITTTADATAAVFVSYNVGDKSLVQNNTEENCKTSVVTASTAGLKDALKAGNETVKLGAGTYTFPTSDFKAGTTLICEEGTVFDGKTGFNINGATVVGATFTNDNAYVCNSTTVNGTYKDCVFTDSDGLRYCYAGETAVFENCVFDTDFYGVHFDGGANDLLFKNCTFSGFNTFGSAVTKLTLEGCTFKYNGKGGYCGINLWGNSELIDCTFVFDGKASVEWVDLCGDNKTVEFTNCVIVDANGTEVDIETAGIVGDYGTGNTIIYN